MRLGPLLTPVGPLPAGVYWRRRAAAAAVALAVVLLVVLLARSVAGPDRLRPAPDGGRAPEAAPTAGTTSPASTPSPATTASPATPSPGMASSPSRSAAATPAPADPSALAPEDCAAGDVRVDVTPSPGTVRAGDRVAFTVRVTATGRPCRLDVGPVARSARVLRGGEPVWSTEDCEAGDDSEPVLLEPGSPRELVVRWEGDRTLPGCPPGLGRPGPGQYAVVVQVGPARSPAVPVRLT